MRKKSLPLRKGRTKEKDKRDSHPLNLPPDELRRLSAAMSAQESAQPSQNSMDIDSEGPVPSQTTASPNSLPKPSPGSPLENANGIPNGVNEDGGDEKIPTPPLHRVPTTDMPAIDAEAAKAAGNKFFKAKDYSRAIAEYTKGRQSSSRFLHVPSC